MGIATFTRAASVALVGIGLVASTAFAAVDFDPATGTGFVGKGDIQELYGWNNKQLNQNADDVKFRVVSETVTEVSWECTNDNNDKVQERERTTTTESTKVASHIERDNKKQITGFILDGYGATQSSDSTTDGPAVNSCPSGPWSLTSPAGDPEVVSSTGEVQVSKGNGFTTIYSF